MKERKNEFHFPPDICSFSKSNTLINKTEMAAQELMQHLYLMQA